MRLLAWCNTSDFYHSHVGFAAAGFEVEVYAEICFDAMTTQKDKTKQWLPWFSFSEDNKKAQCLFCNKTKIYRRDRCLEHYGYTPNPEKELRAICKRMPMAVRDRFKNCNNVVPGRMSHVEMYGTLAESSGATQPVQT